MANALSDFLIYEGEKLIACYSWVSGKRADKIEAAAKKRFANRQIFMRHGNQWLNADPYRFGYRI